MERWKGGKGQSPKRDRSIRMKKPLQDLPSETFSVTYIDYKSDNNCSMVKCLILADTVALSLFGDCPVLESGSNSFSTLPVVS